MGYAVRERSGARVLRYRIYSRYGSRSDYDTFRGTLSRRNLDPRTTRLVLRLRLYARGFTCEAEVHNDIDPSDGQVFAGHTDDDEPVVIVKHEGLVEWISGYGTECGREFMEGLLEDAAPMTSPTAFGWDGWLPPPSHLEGYAQAVLLSGTFTGSTARGTVRIRARRGSTRCDTKARRWVARG